MKKIFFSLCASLVFALAAPSCVDPLTPLELETRTAMIDWGAEIPSVVAWPDPQTEYVLVDIPVVALGYEADYDREFYIAQSNLYAGNPWSFYTGMPGESFESVADRPFILPANQMETTIRIKFLYDHLRLNSGAGSYGYTISFRFVFRPGDELAGVSRQISLRVNRGPEYGPALPLIP